MKRGLPFIELWNYFMQKQRTADGRVNYGQPMTYAQISLEIPNAPSPRTLSRWVGKFRQEGYIETRVCRVGGTAIGFTVRILKDRRQLGLFPSPAASASRESAQASASPVGKSVQKPVETLWYRPYPLPSDYGGRSRQICRGKERELLNTKKPFRAEPRRAAASLWNLHQKARRLERELGIRKELMSGARRGDPDDDLKWQRIDALAAELDCTWQQIDLEQRKAG